MIYCIWCSLQYLLIYQLKWKWKQKNNNSTNNYVIILLCIGIHTLFELRVNADKLSIFLSACVPGFIERFRWVYKHVAWFVILDILFWTLKAGWFWEKNKKYFSSYCEWQNTVTVKVLPSVIWFSMKFTDVRNCIIFMALTVSVRELVFPVWVCQVL